MKNLDQILRLLQTVLLCLTTIIVNSQVNNDECFSATNIDDITQFCSEGFSNTNGTSSSEDVPDCWNSGAESSDVWYSFTPRNSGLLLRFFGSGNNSEFTIDNVSMAIYAGRCTSLSEVECIRRNAGADDIFERVFTDLLIGRIHYLRISTTSGDAGTFQLCLSDFAPIPEPQQDCNTGVILCDKSPFVVENIEGVGLIQDEAQGSCLDGIGPFSLPTQIPDATETSSVWYRWTAASSGSLTFTLFPNNDDSEEDLDFAIYRLPLGIDDCNGKELLRCMASGAPNPGDVICLGPTGLRSGETDIVEYVNCEQGSNNFLSPLDMISGESYALIVNNFSNSGFGFTVEWGGSGTFLGPDADFTFDTIDEFECDKTITFRNTSDSRTDRIIEYQWRFGEGASPQSAVGEDPKEVIYESFGPKVATLTVETERGCRVTKVIDIEVEPCCNDLDLLSLTPSITDLTCFESNDGIIQAEALNGTPEYLFSLDNGPLNPQRIYNGLAAGAYSLSAIDVKGCEVSEMITISQPEEIQLLLNGPQDTIELGQGGQFFSQFSPSDRILIYSWSPPDGLSCTDCPNPEVIPPGTSVYTLTVEDQDGCLQMADIIIFTTDFKPLFAPNIISLSAVNPENSFFRVHSNVSADMLELISIYDRWGNKLYSEQNIDLMSQSYIGWNGITNQNSQKVNPGVYIWLAKVRFIDGEVRTFTGDLTIVH